VSKAISSAQTSTMPVWLDAQLIVVSGATAADFLQGYLTCDTLRIDGKSAVPMAICTVKGRVLASGWATGLDEAVGLIVHRSLTASIVDFLKPYVTFSKCTLAVSDDLVLKITDMKSGIELLPDLSVAIEPSPAEATPQMYEDVSVDVHDILIANAFAFVSSEISERFLPQMLGLDQQGAVDFDKGCYLGQEIVARAKFRGAVKRSLAPFSWQTDSTAGQEPVIGQVWQDMGTVIDVSRHGSGLVIVKTSND
jgi:folate-binding protein YgfZ